MTLLENNTLLEISISLFIRKKIKRMNYNYYGTNTIISGLLLFKYNKSLRGCGKKAEIQGARQQLFLPHSPPKIDIPLHCHCWRVPLYSETWPLTNEIRGFLQKVPTIHENALSRAMATKASSNHPLSHTPFFHSLLHTPHHPPQPTGGFSNNLLVPSQLEEG